MKIMDKAWMELIAEGAEQLGVSIDESCIRGFGAHANHLVMWNRKINLTTIILPEEMALKHYVDSLAPLPYLPLACRIIDIGTGGGFPGIPLKIVRPSLYMVLVDSARKKVHFLKDAIRLLKLQDISAHHSRVEELTFEAEKAAGFDVAVMRAFSSLDECVRKALPLLKPGGMILAMKGRDVSPEIETVRNSIYEEEGGKKRAGASLDIQVISYALPRTGDGRSIVILRK